MNRRDQDFMSIALDLARLAEGRTSPNPMVGAVIVKDGKILATGFHKGPGSPHAEVEAMWKLQIPSSKFQISKTKLKGVTLYVNLEPCCPPKAGGRTPPCTEAIIRSGIRRVVIGTKDPDPNVRGRGIQRLKRSGIKVHLGVLNEDCRQLNEAYFVHRMKKRPFVIQKMVVTLDGKVGKGRGIPVIISGRESQRFSHQLRDEVDAILVGIGTVLSDNPLLTTRLAGKRGRDPVRIVLDSRLKIPLSARLLHLDSTSPTWIFTTGGTEKKRSSLVKLGSRVITCKRDASGRIDPADLLHRLAEMGIMTLLVEGGPTIWKTFFDRKLVDRHLIFLTPGLLGKKGLNVPLQPDWFQADRISVESLGRDILVDLRPKLAT